ncbi:hypothetical protein [Listeria monocytogenes]|uniref:Colicin D immunity protein domain-containing protein n=3 Tax=Listeria monocytogenes TaxID=1639 RepID=A0A7U7R8P6_LISMN|nr:hypothetical protein [Listeria monocytogenes]EAG6252509.1 hypothetical protein [Listeria monocytogenes CFSAN003806]EAG6261858.1 hypothetical protein [Listeria monocytogenes CFSAN003725]MDA49384.1 hypothetical protein [Listeria monocytogenes serotype 1/2b]AQP60432.1 hypothetical protein B0X32_14055 [Listeria monocytogenes]AQZ42648.1 hypothetical protein A6K41_01805 [Listeria monocytogenes]
MTKKEQLYFLLNGMDNGEIEINTFINQFIKIFDLEIDYDELSKDEYTILGNVSDMAARFSDSEEDLKLPNVYYSEKQVREEVTRSLEALA